MLNAVPRIGTCRKKVMGLLRLMGNKADVVKGLAKRCNENWSVAPKSDIVCSPSCGCLHPMSHHLSSQGLYLSDIQVGAHQSSAVSPTLTRLYQDHLITTTQNLNHYEKILSRSHSN